MALIAKVMSPTVISDKAIIHVGTCSKRLLRKTSNSPSKNSGTKFNQNLLHKRDRKEMGALCKIQKAFPSRLTEGKAKRIAMALSTKPAKPRLAKETSVRMVPAGMGDRSSGSTLKL